MPIVRLDQSSLKRRPILAGAASALILAGAVFASGPAAIAAPGSPGVPSDPTIVYLETFESAADTGPRTLLSDIVGTTGITYTAAPYWLDPSKCNGFVMAMSNTTRVSTDCVIFPERPESDWNEAYNSLRQLAYALGVVNGSADPTTNSAVAAYTHTFQPDPTPNLVEFEMETALPFSGLNKFLLFSVNVAATNCVEAPDDAKLQFYQKVGAVEIPVSVAAIDVCDTTDPRTSAIAGIPNVGGAASTYYAGSFASDMAFLSGGEDVLLVMRNEQSGSWGNDAAFDDIQILDASPQLDKSFADTTLGLGDTTRLTFTITNTSELGAKAGWSFTDTLPTGMVVAPVPDVSTTCANGTVTAVPGSGTIDVAGDLEEGEVFCTAEVNVRMPAALNSGNASGLLSNCAANISNVVGLNLPGCASVQVPPLVLARTGADTTVTVVGAGIAVALLSGGLLAFRIQRRAVLSRR